MVLTDELLLDYKRCRRRAFLEIYGDICEQEQPQDFLLKLQQESLAHKQAVLEITPHQQANYPFGNWEAGAKATWKLMQQGTERISQGVLLTKTVEGLTLVSFPDLLVKQPGKSIFGDWFYVSTTIKLGKRPKPEYKIVAAFCTQLLAVVQGVWPTSAGLILRRQNPHAVNLDIWIPVMQKLVAECIETLQQQQEPEVFISRQKCGLCQWYNSCHAIAKSQKHLSLLPGVTPRRYQELQSLGLTTVESIANAQVTTLESVLSQKIAADLVEQAQSTAQNRAILRHNYYPTLKNFQGSNSSWEVRETTSSGEHLPPKTSQPYINPLPTASVELYFDIEAEPSLKLDYLLGVLVVDRRTGTEKFYPLLAEKPAKEESIWQQFLDLVWLYPDAPIFHFANYEVETIKRLAKLYQTSSQLIKPLLPRFVDIHQQVVSTVALPVESYSLKNLARWLGFEWRDENITGSQCVCLYSRWLATGNRSVLEIIERYNEDDCRATYLLKQWLADFYQKTLV
ncbi:MAG: TM0106 family RecB-like putative nuclease [Symploca sp. SIO2C1]|nr:TM0106 family RecB-like putative nuclease [Symploca sp. SIO2C1]